MSKDAAYELLTKRIASLLILVDIEKQKLKLSVTPSELDLSHKRLDNLKELLDTNMRAFAMIFNRNFDMKLDLDTEMQ